MIQRAAFDSQTVCFSINNQYSTCMYAYLNGGQSKLARVSDVYTHQMSSYCLRNILLFSFFKNTKFIFKIYYLLKNFIFSMEFTIFFFLQTFLQND